MGYPTFLFVVFVGTLAVSVTSAAMFASPGGPPANPPPPGIGGSPGAFGGFGGAPPAGSGAGGAGAPAGGLPSDPSCPPTDGMVPLYVPDPDDCTKYTVCSAGFGMKMDCPPWSAFQQGLQPLRLPASRRL
ncbi:hypothetical protein MRX96_024115 [Rhipicephalus microplus]